jgi:hypothetical protein
MSVKGKKNVCVVDFMNTRQDISMAFSQYWGMTTLVDMSSDPLRKLDAIAKHLLQIEGQYFVLFLHVFI